MDVESLHRAVAKWSHSVELSAPCASLQDVGALLLDLAKRLLVDSGVTEAGYKERVDVLRKTKQSLHVAVKKMLSPAAWKLVRDDRGIAFAGKLEEHRFDLSAHNGAPIFGANAISFDVPDTRRLRQLVDATKWAVEDVRARNQDALLSVIVSKPRTENEELYDQSRRVLGELGAIVTHDTDDELDRWSNQIASEIRQHLPKHLGLFDA